MRAKFGRGPTVVSKKGSLKFISICTLPIQFQRRLTKYSNLHSTRQNKSFVKVHVRTNIKAMCLSVYGVKLWNTLPTSVNIEISQKHFLSHY